MQGCSSSMFFDGGCFRKNLFISDAVEELRCCSLNILLSKIFQNVGTLII